MKPIKCLFYVGISQDQASCLEVSLRKFDIDKIKCAISEIDQTAHFNIEITDNVFCLRRNKVIKKAIYIDMSDRELLFASYLRVILVRLLCGIAPYSTPLSEFKMTQEMYDYMSSKKKCFNEVTNNTTHPYLQWFETAEDCVLYSKNAGYAIDVLRKCKLPKSILKKSRSLAEYLSLIKNQDDSIFKTHGEDAVRIVKQLRIIMGND